MESLLSPVHLLLVNLVAHFGTSYQQQNVQSLLAALLSQPSKTLYHNRWKSASALSRFLSQVQWSMEPLIVMIRAFLLSQLLAPRGRGRRPELQIMVDLTSIPKEGKCRRFRHWLHYFHNCFGFHIVVLYLCCGHQRLPWSLAIYRGKGTTSPPQLAICLIRQLPLILRQHYRVRVLADGGFCSQAFLQAMRQMKIPALVGCGHNRVLEDGRTLQHLYHRGQQVRLTNVAFPVWVSWCFQKQADGIYRKRFILSTQCLSAASMTRLGALRWRIEAFFKTMKQRFWAGRFAFRRLKAVLRWLFLAWLAYLLSHWVAVAQGEITCPDWTAASQETAEIFFFALMLHWHDREAERLRAKRQALPDFDLSFLVASQ